MGGRFVGRVDMDDKIKPNGGEKNQKEQQLKQKNANRSNPRQHKTWQITWMQLMFFFLYIFYWVWNIKAKKRKTGQWGKVNSPSSLKCRPLLRTYSHPSKHADNRGERCRKRRIGRNKSRKEGGQVKRKLSSEVYLQGGQDFTEFQCRLVQLNRKEQI